MPVTFARSGQHARRDVHADTGVEHAVVVQRAQQCPTTATYFEHPQATPEFVPDTCGPFGHPPPLRAAHPDVGVGTVVQPGHRIIGTDGCGGVGQAADRLPRGGTQVLAGGADRTVRLPARCIDQVQVGAGRRAAARPGEPVLTRRYRGVVAVTEGGYSENVGEERREPARGAAGVEVRLAGHRERYCHRAPFVRGELLGPGGRPEHRAVHSGMADEMQLVDHAARLGQAGELGDEVRLVMQARHHDLGIGVGCAQLTRHCRGRHRELLRAASVTRGVGHPDHGRRSSIGSDPGERDAWVLSGRNPGTVVADQLQHFGSVQIEHPHAGRRRTVEVQGQTTVQAGHVVDDVAGDARDRAGQVFCATGDGQPWTVPAEPPLFEPALQDDDETACPAVIVRCAALTRPPPGQHDLDLVVDPQDRPGVGLTVIRVGRLPGQCRLRAGHPRQQVGSGDLSPDRDAGQHVEQ